MNTPYFVIDKAELDRNISDFKEAMSAHWPNSIFSYSVKTNSLPWVLKYMLYNDIMAEVVSDEEYDLALMSGFRHDQIVYNGPIKSIELLEIASKNNSIINIDSEKELEYVLNNIDKFRQNIGIRINISPTYFENKDISYIDEGFRFGFSEKNGRLEEIINTFKKFKINNLGLHFHVNSVTRSLGVYETIASYAARIIEKYNLTPSYIDIGGGFFGGISDKPTAFDYILILKETLCDVVDINKTKLIIEPGSAIIGSTMELHSTVVDVKDTEISRIVTTDASRFHIDPLWRKANYHYEVEKKTRKENKKIEKQVICGYTCMDHDRIMRLEYENELNTGDKIVYKKVGAYTVTLGAPFIKFYPPVYLREYGEFTLVREEMTTKEYFNVQSTVKEKK